MIKIIKNKKCLWNTKKGLCNAISITSKRILLINNIVTSTYNHTLRLFFFNLIFFLLLDQTEAIKDSTLALTALKLKQRASV